MRFSIPDRSDHVLRHARWDARHVARGIAAVDAGRDPDQLGEPAAERAQRRTAHLEADLGDAEIAAAHLSQTNIPSVPVMGARSALRLRDQ
jgi:hypothetical protein